MDDRLQTLVNQYKKKCNAVMKKNKFKKVVDSVVGNPSKWPKSRLDMFVSDITLQEDIAGKVASEPKKYGMKNKESYAVLAIMREEIMRKVRPKMTKVSSKKNMSKKGSLRNKKKRRSSNKNKSSKKSKPSKKSKSSKKTRRRTRRRRY